MAEHPQWPEGLTSAEAAARLAADGPNLLAAERRRSWGRTLLEIVRDPMFLLLLGAGSIYLVLGDRLEAAALLGFVAIIILAAALQQRRTEHALEALRELSSPHALAIRDGRPVRIPGPQVVAGDMVLLDEGSRIVADGRLIQAHNLAVDESLLSGESLPVAKRAADGASGEPVGLAYAGTLVTAGQGWLRVTATGSRTAFGRIGRALDTVERPPSPCRPSWSG
ncbi:hypothetical protein H9L41_21030 [Chitinimonas koreensis]|nr:hypothetical protein H9L41_21030 [Chitinimonas koreensis]